MKKLNTLLLSAVLLMTATASFAKSEDVKLEDNKLILGKWDLQYEAPALHKEKKAVKIKWEFKKNGKLITSATDTRARTRALSIQLKYSVEDGVIKKQSTPGREKYESCRVISLKGKDMVLKCKYLFFFLQKK